MAILFGIIVWIWVDERQKLIIPSLFLTLGLIIQRIILTVKIRKKRVKEVSLLDESVLVKPGWIIVTEDPFSYFSESDKESKWKEFKDIKAKEINVVFPQGPVKVKTHMSLFLFYNNEELHQLIKECKFTAVNYVGLFPYS